MNKTLILSFSFLLFFNFSYSQSFKIETYKLENGLTVILNEDHSQSKVFGSVTCKAGGKNDPSDATGMAHYQEHMLFKGTQEIGTLDWTEEKLHIDKIFELYDQLGNTTDELQRAEIQQQINSESLAANKYAIQNEFSNLVKSIGGTNLNAGTGWDMTVYYNAFPPNEIEAWLELYSHRFENPVFRGFQQELEVVYEEKNLYSDIFIFPLLEQFNKNFFKNHPYGQRTLVGSVDNLKNPSLTKMYEFFKTYYVPNNMALILSGDFETEKVKDIINAKFGDWVYSEVPEPIVYEEKEFNGREFIEVNLSPIKLEFLGFRTVPQGHDDEEIMNVFNALLSNTNSTGLLDKLVIDSKIMAAQVLPMPYFDHGATIILAIPKIVGQTLEEAEELVMTEIKKLKNGEITQDELDAVKNQLYIQNQLSLENLEQRTYSIANAFALGKDVEIYINNSEKIKNVTIDDVKRIANAYFGDNYLAYYSKMGSVKKEKIEKPNYEPIISNTEVKSTYAQKIDAIKTEDYNIDYIDFKNDIRTAEISENCNIFYTENTNNDIYSLTIKFGAGNIKIPKLKYAASLMNVSGCKEYNVNELKFEFSKIGTTYSITSDDDYLYITLEGIETNMKQALILINKLINEPVCEEDKIKTIIEGEQTSRKMEKSEPDNIAEALFNYVLYSDRSDYLDRLSLDEINKLKASELVDEFKKALIYEVEIHYIGNPEIIEFEDVKNSITNEIKFNEKLEKSTSPEFQDINNYTQNTVFFVNKKDATQSKIYILINGVSYDISQQATIDAFNLYFGGDFSGLVLQEIREYRSLAYTAGAGYKTPNILGKENYFIGYVGTQADKTLTALEVFNGLLTDMPQKPDRIDMIKKYLTLSSITAKPDFRNISEYIVKMENKGFNNDPVEYKMSDYQNMTFEQIQKFYEDNIKGKPITFAIVGDKKRIDMKELEKYGKIITVKEKELFND